jgi:hypothetical protein
MARFPDRREWENGFQLERNGKLIWHMDGYKTNEGTEAGVYEYGSGKRL